jgi:hypothetical protein
MGRRPLACWDCGFEFRWRHGYSVCCECWCCQIEGCASDRLRLIQTCHAAPIPCPCRVNSHLPCRAPAIFRQFRVLRESPHGSRKYPNCYSYSLTDWYASDNNLRGTPRVSRKKPNAGRSPTSRLWTADANSHMPCPCCANAALCCGLEKSLSERHGRGKARALHGMGVAWHGRGMACVNQTRPHCVNQIGK